MRRTASTSCGASARTGGASSRRPGQDPPYDTGLALAASIAEDYAVAILTARPNYMAADTRSWLAANEVRHDLLILRPRHGRGSGGPSADFKRHEISRLRAAGFEIKLAIDDDERIIDMYRSEDIFALYTHSGYYERYASRPSERPAPTPGRSALRWASRRRERDASSPSGRVSAPGRSAPRWRRDR